MDRWEIFLPQACPLAYPRGRRNKCEEDSLRLAQQHPDLTLVAGYLLCDSFWWGHFWCVEEDGQLVDTSPRESAPTKLYVGVRLDTEEATQAAAESNRWWKRYVRRRLFFDELPEPLLWLTDPWVFPAFYSEMDRDRALTYVFTPSEQEPQEPSIGVCLKCKREAPADRSLNDEHGEWHEVATVFGPHTVEDAPVILLVCPQCEHKVAGKGSPVRKLRTDVD